MKTLIYQDYLQLSRGTAGMIADVLQSKPEALLCFPAGATSIGTFNILIEMHRDGEIDFQKCSIVGLDEWVGLGPANTENCYHFLRKHLLDPLKIKNRQICFFDGESSHLEEECKKTDQYIRDRGGIDLMLLGIGMNGHLGLNEPGIPFDKNAHIVNLDSVTRQIGQKYFSNKVELKQGITLGMNHIRDSKSVILQISGAAKTHLYEKLTTCEVNDRFPASYLKTLPQAFLCADADACGI